ncbi:MAG: site-specific DNA-methyltransferase [Helicobacteraceae bacterium]|nr:site-specific DNA-methyltransferase [Helicobacteraceae bacterium]
MAKQKSNKSKEAKSLQTKQNITHKSGKDFALSKNVSLDSIHSSNLAESTFQSTNQSLLQKNLCLNHSYKINKTIPIDKLIDRILQGDSLKLLKQIPDSSIDLIFADPPYFMQVSGVLKRPEGCDFSGCDDTWDSFRDNEDYNAFSKTWLKECFRILKPNGSIWVIGSMQCIYSIGGLMQELGFWFINDVVWQKSNPMPNFHGTRLNNSHETLIWATKSKKSKYTFNYKTAKELNNEIVGFKDGERRQLSSVWQLPVCNGNERLKDSIGDKIHSTQKPESLLYRIIAISSKMGDYCARPIWWDDDHSGNGKETRQALHYARERKNT